MCTKVEVAVRHHLNLKNVLEKIRWNFGRTKKKMEASSVVAAANRLWEKIKKNFAWGQEGFKFKAWLRTKAVKEKLVFLFSFFSFSENVCVCGYRVRLSGVLDIPLWFLVTRLLWYKMIYVLGAILPSPILFNSQTHLCKYAMVHQPVFCADCFSLFL